MKLSEEDIRNLYPSCGVIIDGHNNAILGFDYENHKLIYSQTRIVNNLMKDSEMNREDALEFFAFNIGCAYMGETTPTYCDDELLNVE